MGKGRGEKYVHITNIGSGERNGDRQGNGDGAELHCRLCVSGITVGGCWLEFFIRRTLDFVCFANQCKERLCVMRFESCGKMRGGFYKSLI